MITRTLSVLFVFCFYASPAQFQESFSETLTNPHLWEGTTAYFKINEEQQLQSDGPAASGKIFLQTYSNALVGASWSFSLKMNFESSATNYAKVFLASSSGDLLDPNLEAYYLKIGGLSGNKDGIDLYYQKGAVATLVAKGREGRAAGNPVTLRLKISRDSKGKWEVYADTLGGENFQLESTGTHAAVFSSQAFGFLCIHSSTRKTGFYFDDLSINGGFTDIEAPRLLSQTYQTDLGGWLLSFDEMLDPLSVPVFQKGEKDLLPFIYTWISGTSLLVKDTASIIGQGMGLDVILSGFSDRQGNAAVQSIKFIRPKTMAKGDVAINEILFNPFSYGVDFIELYNCSPWFVQLAEASIRNQSAGEAKVPQLVMEPGSYRVLTKDSFAVTDFYPLSAKHTFSTCNLPGFPDDKGSVILLNKTEDTIDFMDYSQAMHHPLLESKEGVSLERIDAFGSSQWPQNWQSASTSSGGATPGYVNSQAGSVKSEGLLSIEPHSISPGTDGYRNYATIRYTLPKPGGSVRMDIFSLQGHWICSLQPSGPSDRQGVCTWNGTDTNLQPVSTGLYLIVAEFFHPDGDRIKIKDTISVLLR